MLSVSQNLQTYEVWDDDAFQPIELSFYASRSRLFRLPPIGIGTAYVESLSSYISRLAQAHSLATGQLVTAEILPLLSARPATASALEGEAASTPFQTQTKEVNGLSSVTEDWIEVVNSLTHQSNLHLLTILPYASLLSNKGLLRSERVWCAACYTEWQQSSQPLYEPLVWQVWLLERCLRHPQPLQKRCPNSSCGKTQSLLAAFSRPGYCSHCLGWLGQSNPSIASTISTTEDGFKEKEDENQASGQVGLNQEWVSQQIAALVAALPSLPHLMSASATSFKSAIEKWVSQQLAEGTTLKDLAESSGVSVATLKDWQNGNTLPSLGDLLKFCQSLKQELLPLLVRGELSAQTLVLTPSSNFAVQTRGKPKISKTVAKGGKRLPFVKLHQKLQQIADDKSKSPPSLTEVAEQLGYQEKHLHKDFPRLAHTIETNYKARHSDFTSEQRQLAEVLSGNENPPPSMQEVARRVGRSQSLLKKHFPQEYAAIVERHQHYRQTYYKQMEEQKAELIRQSVQELVRQGLYPSSNRIGQLIGDNHFMFKAVYAAAWRESLHILGY